MNSTIFHRIHKAILTFVAALMLIAIPLVCVFSPSLSALAASTSEVTPETTLRWSNTTQVETAQGTIEGILRDVTMLNGQTASVYAWLGIPYAKNPETEEEKAMMRWAAPQPPVPWKGVLETKMRTRCLQIPIPKAFDLDGEIYGNEKCLHANVWRPQSMETDLPIYIDIHGGGNVFGRGQYLAHLAAEYNAVTISFNYRLSVFRQLRAPGLETGDPLGDSGNFSILDGLRLLEWVQQNASAFGGDPNLVTLGGYSAGGGLAWALLTSPATQGRGLFHRAVIQSALLGNQTFTAEQNYETSRRLLTHYLYQSDPSLSFQAASERATQLHQAGESGSVLRSINPVTLLCLVNRDRAVEWPKQCGELRPLPPDVEVGFKFHPTSDGVVQPLVSQLQALRNGDFVQVPVLLGAAQRETKFFTVGIWLSFDEATQQKQGLPSREQFNTLFTQFNPDNPMRPLPGIGVPTVEFILPDDQTAQDYENTQTATSLIATGLLANRGANAVQAHVPVLVYQFRWTRQPAPFDKILGASHTIDLPFWLQTFEADGNEYQVQPVGFSQQNKLGRVDLAQKMGIFFRNYLRNGDPNQGERPPTPWIRWRRRAIFKRLYLDATDSAAQLRMGL